VRFLCKKAYSMINRQAFFNSVRRVLFNGRIGTRQTEGMTAILDRGEAGLETLDRRALAYMLATAHHETARTFQPVRERGGVDYLRKNYDITGNRPQLARANGNLEPGDGIRYSGRGFVQLTWKNNYRFAGEKLGIDLVATPDRALDLMTATEILVRGMREGWFTGKKLSDYFNASDTDWINARRIINGVDMARTIAGYAQAYFAALGVEAPPATVKPSDAVPPPKAAPRPRKRSR
jgi:putative chitinase